MVKVRCPKCGMIFPPEARDVQICPNCGCVMRVTRRAAAKRYITDRRDDQYEYRVPQAPRLPERSGVYLSREEYENLLYKARSRREYPADRGYYREGYSEDYAGYAPAYDTPREVYDYRLGRDRDYPPAYRRPEQEAAPVREPAGAPAYAPSFSAPYEPAYEAPMPQPASSAQPAPAAPVQPAPAAPVQPAPAAAEPVPEPAPAPEPEPEAAPAHEPAAERPVPGPFTALFAEDREKEGAAAVEDKPAPAAEERPAAETAPEAKPFVSLRPDPVPGPDAAAEEEEKPSPVVSSYSPFARPSTMRPFGTSAYDRPAASTDIFRPARPEPATASPFAPSVPEKAAEAPAERTRRYSVPATVVAVIVALAAGVMNGLLLILGVFRVDSLFSGTNGLDIIQIFGTESIAEMIITIAVIAAPVVLAVLGIIGASAHKKPLMAIVGILLIVTAVATTFYGVLVNLPSKGFENFTELVRSNFESLTLWVYIAGGLSLVAAITQFVCAGTTKRK